MTLPVLTYGSSNWAVSLSDKILTETPQITFLMYRPMVDHSLRDHIRKDTIRVKLKICNLNYIILEGK